MRIVDEEAPDGRAVMRFAFAGDSALAWAGDRHVATVRMSPDRLVCAVDVVDEGRCRRTQAAQLVAAVMHLTRSVVTLEARNPVVRDEARRAGFTGPLRGPLQSALSGGGLPPLGTFIESMIGVPLMAQRSEGGARRLLAAARFGFRDVARLRLADPRLEVTLPVHADLMVENVALAIDTLVAIRRWFGEDATHVDRLSFDLARYGGGQASWAGMANPTAFIIHINADFVLADAYAAMRRHRPDGASPRQPAVVTGPFTGLDGTVAHEAWHHIEAGFASRRLADRTELRRQLGLVLGVETLEQAVNGGHRNAPEPWRVAHGRLAAMVSAYATTNPIEATAELFKLWWCRASNPVVDRFGELLQEFFSVAPR